MLKRYYAIACAISLLTACGSDGTPVAPGGPARTTETFVLTTTILQRDGGTLYPSGTPFPTIVVNQTGLVEARVSFTPVAGCEFRFNLVRSAASGTSVLTVGGPGPELAFQGAVTADTYRLGLVARLGGVSLCGELPFEGVLLPHTIVVTHP